MCGTVVKAVANLLGIHADHEERKNGNRFFESDFFLNITTWLEMDIFFLKILKNKGDKRRRRKIYWYLPEYYNPLVRAVHILENFEVFFMFL